MTLAISTKPNATTVWLQRIQQTQRSGCLAIIAEIKLHTPTAGDLLRGRSLTDIVQAYENGGATCLSVVTGKWFGGDIQLLEKVAAVSQLPILRKDLIVNQKQLIESKQRGASAVLLTKKLLSEDHLQRLIDACLELELTPFLEVNNSEELRSLAANPQIAVGICNRDIAQKEADTNSGLNNALLINELNVDVGAIISASGISGAAEAQHLQSLGFDGLLVGTALMTATNTEQAVRELVQN